MDIKEMQTSEDMSVEHPQQTLNLRKKRKEIPGVPFAHNRRSWSLEELFTDMSQDQHSVSAPSPITKMTAGGTGDLCACADG